MRYTRFLFICAFLFACNNHGSAEKESASHTLISNTNISGHWEGIFTNGMKKTYISFDVSANGKELRNFTFKGYWHCGGKLELATLGFKKSVAINGNKIDVVVTEPEGGGATATRYELHGIFNGETAAGTFRMNINALGCDTYKLNWVANKK